jgi:hypothetical protein
MRAKILEILNALASGNISAGLKEIFGLPQAVLDNLSSSDPEYGEILHAAKLLKMGEFQYLQSAFANWHGREMTEAETNRYFRSFIIDHRIPWWARESARKMTRERAGKQAA